MLARAKSVVAAHSSDCITSAVRPWQAKPGGP